MILDKKVISHIAIVTLLSTTVYFINPVFSLEVLILGISILGLDLLFGYMGLLSFGHMSFVGMGAYALVLSYKFLANNIVLSSIISILSVVTLAMLVGPLVLRRGGAFFGLTLMALNEILWFLVAVYFAPITGGTAGIGYRFPRTPIIDITTMEGDFIITLASVIVLIIVMHRLTGSLFGLAIRAIRENETKLSFLGYNTFKLKYIAFVISAAICGWSGILYAFHYSYISPDIISPLTNLMLILAVVLGGPGTILGSFVGAFVLVGLKDVVNIYFPRWELFLGVTTIVIVLRFRGGIIGYLRRARISREVL
ncbi:MAG: branched-chain amino acid ABC transporter permease [Candidatus Nezhaarchaeales archaeon]